MASESVCILIRFAAITYATTMSVLYLYILRRSCFRFCFFFLYMYDIFGQHSLPRAFTCRLLY